MKKKRLVFIVSVEVLQDNDDFKTVATGLELHEPVWYSDRVMRQTIEEEYPELFKKELEGKSWNIILEEWLD